MNAPQKATNAKTGGQKPTEKTDVPKQDTAPLTEEQVRKIVEAALSSSMKDLTKSMESSIKKTVEDAIQKSGKSIETAVGKTVDGKLTNQTNLTKNVQKGTNELKDLVGGLKKDIQSSGTSYGQWFDALKETVNSVDQRITKLENALQDKDSGDGPIDVENVSGAVVSLAQMSKSISEMEDSIVIVASEGPNLVKNLQDAAESVRTSVKDIESCTNLLSDDGGRLSSLMNSIDALSGQAAKACLDIEEKIRRAEETMTGRQAELEALVQQMNELLSAPKIFQNEVVGRMERILETLSESVKRLDDQLNDAKEKLSSLGNFSAFREKAMLSVSFAEAAKSLQAAFEKSMDQVSKDEA